MEDNVRRQEMYQEYKKNEIKIEIEFEVSENV